MKKKIIIAGFLFAAFGFTNMNAQINLGDKAIGALQKGVASFTLSNADAAALSKEAVRKLDSTNEVAGPNDGYTLRLNRVFGKHTAGEGFTLNYKVYKLKEVNAFATADGSVRVYSGLMDIMDDNELLAVIGHEIGHVANNDSRDAMRAAYQKEALIDGASSQSAKISAVTDSQLGKIGSALIDSKHSRKQETEADLYSYNFLKKNGYNVNAEESAFRILAKMSEGAEASFIDQMMSSHPDSKKRADDAKARAEKDGVYKPYVQQKIDNTVPKAATVKKTTTTKKTTTKKK
ncbi:M48 family metalloprotease [Flavobacterium johnsoniae]|jgi:putative metalloprotease|uniref:Peptidase subfamily M48-like protein n=1 Tax=Flavobacterium johnsoniae (strain ATCC 17061 / DSM 2064 / JCM 8514 / BCRC 14874 / CCUG 350202 / NBRC 14942 / NCIMB 11054 / UW101) TaxID=376686 RepID=A5FNF7_FLAJ1|nr:M48 family metalloprotease [Flavobacterium johnsoniae]ABQ03262.1 Peptidase subfamily M48-like protein [Flavobacterium johnsoniae UW101]OXG01315.1 peptidase [Flavobacterium johnsoniae UW101]WQG79873.1 M48 family metalloprotease [Flavobacterium johnsoniae UW101]SHL80502.1 putative metalloprotease [Flavobacterium johnsoniae]